jgi:hypothetical protein
VATAQDASAKPEAAVSRSVPPELEEPGFDVPVRPPEPPTKTDGTSPAPEGGPHPEEEADGGVHTRSTAKEMAAVTRAQEAEYLASRETEAPVVPEPPPPVVPPPAPSPAPLAPEAPRPPAPAMFGSSGRPLPPPPRITREVKLPPLRLQRPGTPIMFPPVRLDSDTRSAIVPPEPPKRPVEGPAAPRATGAETTIARPQGATAASLPVDITDKSGSDRASAVPYSTRKTLEVPIDRALIDATIAAASSRATVELLPTPAPAAAPPAPAPSRPTLEIDSPFDAGWDDLEPPATPVREVIPALVEEAAGLVPEKTTK